MPAVTTKRLVTGQRRNHADTGARHMSATVPEQFIRFESCFPSLGRAAILATRKDPELRVKGAQYSRSYLCVLI